MVWILITGIVMVFLLGLLAWEGLKLVFDSYKKTIDRVMSTLLLAGLFILLYIGIS